MEFLNLTLGQFAALFGVVGAFSVALYLLDRTRRKQVVSTLRFWVEPVQSRSGHAPQQESSNLSRSCCNCWECCCCCRPRRIFNSGAAGTPGAITSWFSIHLCLDKRQYSQPRECNLNGYRASERSPAGSAP